ncbi:MAG: hypothetical protein QM770_04985 [Tepidisphaeraceae bacterium]
MDRVVKGEGDLAAESGADAHGRQIHGEQGPQLDRTVSHVVVGRIEPFDQGSDLSQCRHTTRFHWCAPLSAVVVNVAGVEAVQQMPDVVERVPHMRTNAARHRPDRPLHVLPVVKAANQLGEFLQQNGQRTCKARIRSIIQKVLHHGGFSGWIEQVAYDAANKRGPTTGI